MDGLDFERLSSDAVYSVIVALEGFDEAVVEACKADEPFMIARQLNLIARQFNKFYNDEHILNEPDANLRQGRLAICRSVCRVLRVGLNLLGIDVVERM